LRFDREDEDEVERPLQVIEGREEAVVEEAVRHEREAAGGTPDAIRARRGAVSHSAVGHQGLGLAIAPCRSLRACAATPAMTVVWWRPKSRAMSMRL
jgi:hypothetical protein